MIFELEKTISQKQLEDLVKHLEWMGLRVHVHDEEGTPCLAVVEGWDASVNFEKFIELPHVVKIHQFKRPYKLSGKDFKKVKQGFKIGKSTIGSHELMVMAGPCSVESEEQIFQSAEIVAKAGGNVLRGGAFKPRTSPYSFQGLGEEGLVLLQKAAKHYGLLSVSEVMDIESIDLVSQYCDILQVGARNMQHFSLLKRLGKIKKPILLKRGFAATYQDLLMSAEYILSGGNDKVILCERGLRTFEPFTRNTLDIAAVPILHELSHLPVVVDPSHGTGIRKMVAPMALAAVAAGADGLMIEVHPHPDQALSDVQQTIDAAEFNHIMDSLRIIGPAVNIEIPKKSF